VPEVTQLDASQLAAGRDKRRARLFARHADGARLTAAERAEIADLVASADAAATANDLKLEPPPAHARRTGLAHGLQHYAELLGVGLRTIVRWHVEGRKAKDYCPLDDLEKLGAWWARLHPGRALDVRVVLAVERILDPVGAQVAEVISPNVIGDSKGAGRAAGEAAGEAEPARPGIVLDDVAAGSLDQTLHTLGRIHVANTQLLERAFRSGSQAEVDACHRNVERSAKMLVSAQASLDEHLKRRGDLVPREEIKAELLSLHSAMAQSLVGQLVKIGLLRDRATQFVDTWFRQLGQSRFAATTAPDCTNVSAMRPPASAAA
jgi:hypothetical protein